MDELGWHLFVPDPKVLEGALGLRPPKSVVRNIDGAEGIRLGAHVRMVHSAAMSKLRIGVVGASGYSGTIAARLAHGHPHAELAYATSDQLKGQPVRTRLGIDCSLDFVANDAWKSLPADVVMLCTPAEVSKEIAPRISSRVIDLSNAFRLERHYGLPELFGAPPKDTTLVANPGCYPTASLLALAPLVRAGLVLNDGIVIDGKSGVTGAGRQSKEDYSFGEVNEDVRAYRVLGHQHTPEIKKSLGIERGLTFVPHLLPTSRGLITTCYARPASNSKNFETCLRDTYARTKFVDVVKPEQVTLRSVVGTNRARVAVIANDEVVVAIGAIDNLIKGAAGQAMQNINLWFGLDETAGLELDPFAA
jgi:N-acetyl-gamma-glutamyl-phosphate reductase